MFFAEQHLLVHTPHTHVTCMQNALVKKRRHAHTNALTNQMTDIIVWEGFNTLKREENIRTIVSEIFSFYIVTCAFCIKGSLKFSTDSGLLKDLTLENILGPKLQVWIQRGAAIPWLFLMKSCKFIIIIIIIIISSSLPFQWPFIYRFPKKCILLYYIRYEYWIQVILPNISCLGSYIY